jgi:hypothetical protein
MGLLKGVIEGSLETAYRSLKYREDSNQPYIVVPIPDYTDESGMNFALRAPDFFLRQGALSTTNANIASSRTGINVGVDATFLQLGLFGLNPNVALRIQSNPFDLDAPVPTDALRVGRFLFDTKNIAGALFSVKQNLLERTRVNAPGAGRRVYLPTSTILQAGVNAFGVHLDKTGLDPLDFDRRGYYDVTRENERNLSTSGNRLILIYQTKQLGFPTVSEIALAESLYDIDTTDEAYIYSYRGGPDTLGGLGKTRVRIDGTGYGDPRARTNTYDPKALTPEDRNTYVFGNDLLNDVVNSSISPNIVRDFRETINESIDPTFTSDPSRQVLPYTDYVVFNRDRTYGENVPVVFSSLEAEREAKLDPNITTKYDRINNTNVLTRRRNLETLSALENESPDLIPFYFQILNIDNVTEELDDWYLFFRAYITNMSDSFKADWQSFKYIGRAENFYKYNGFSRDMSLSFTIYAHSRDEMYPLYNKITYLAGTTAPNYSRAGYMRGVMMYLTVGDYLRSTPVIMNNISLKPSFEAGWEIGRDRSGNNTINAFKLPKMMEVDLSFTPIHNFTPQFEAPFIV